MDNNYNNVKVEDNTWLALVLIFELICCCCWNPAAIVGLIFYYFATHEQPGSDEYYKKLKIAKIIAIAGPVIGIIIDVITGLIGKLTSSVASSF